MYISCTTIKAELCSQDKNNEKDSPSAVVKQQTNKKK